MTITRMTNRIAMIGPNFFGFSALGNGLGMPFIGGVLFGIVLIGGNWFV
jgi:hypothetical protein